MKKVFTTDEISDYLTKKGDSITEKMNEVTSPEMLDELGAKLEVITEIMMDFASAMLKGE